MLVFQEWSLSRRTCSLHNLALQGPKMSKYLSSVGDVSHQGKSVSDLFLLDIMGLIILIV